MLTAAVTSAAGAGCGGDNTRTVTVKAAAPTATSAAATGVERQLTDVVQQLSPRVVQIQTSEGLGSGVVYDDRGAIVTNAHVVGNHKRFTVTLTAGDRHPATLVGTYAPNDLAVIRLDPLPSPAPKAAQFADSSKLEVGQLVLAIGNPLGLRSSVTDGIISSLGRTVPEGNGAVISPAVQTSAPINPGNSGGALGGVDGSVVGIPTLAAIDPQLGGSQAPGIGFAIPSNTVKRIADQLIAGGHVTRSGRAYLGVSIVTSATGDGVVVASVQKGGPADRAGIRPHDVIVKVGGKPTPTAEELSTVLAALKPGQTVPVAIRHPDGKQATVQIKLGENTG